MPQIMPRKVPDSCFFDRILKPMPSRSQSLTIPPHEDRAFNVNRNSPAVYSAMTQPFKCVAGVAIEGNVPSFAILAFGNKQVLPNEVNSCPMDADVLLLPAQSRIKGNDKLFHVVRIIVFDDGTQPRFLGVQ